MRPAEIRDFEAYVLRLASTLTDKYNLHPEDAIQLIEFYEIPVLQWQEAGVPTKVAAGALYDRFEQIQATQPNPIIERVGYTREAYFNSIYVDLINRGFDPPKAKRALIAYKKSIVDYYAVGIPHETTSALIDKHYRGR